MFGKLSMVIGEITPNLKYKIINTVNNGLQNDCQFQFLQHNGMKNGSHKLLNVIKCIHVEFHIDNVSY